ncbi:MAG: PAS domain S-box protein [Acidiferrobacterales bacterium]
MSKHDHSSKDFRKTKAQLIEELQTLRRRVNGANDEASFRSAVENLEDGLAFYDSEDRLVFCNEAYRRLHPAIRDMLKPGVLFEDLVRAHARRGQIPEAIGREEEYVRERMEQHGAPKYSIVRELTNGSWFIIKEGRTSNGGTYAINTDITELKKNEQALSASQEQFRGAIENLQEGFALYDADDRLVMCNEEYRRLHPKTEHILKPGMRFEELVRTNIEHGVNADAIGCEEEHIRQRMKHHRNPTEPLIRTLTDGTTFIIKESRTPAGGVVVTETDITKRRRAEAALRESEDRFRDLIEGSVLGIVIDTDGKPLFANQAFAQIFGYGSPDEIIKMGSLDPLYTPNDLERISGYRKCRAGGAAAPTHYEFEGVKKDGMRIWLETRVRVINWKGENAVQSTVFDVTDRKLAETALRQSEERFRNLVEGSIQGVLIHRDHKPLFVNQVYAQILGYSSPEEILRLDSVLSLYAPHERTRLVEYRKARQEGKDAPPTYEVQAMRKDGTMIWLEHRVCLVNWQGKPANQTTTVDITERKRAEEALRESEERFRAVVDNAPFSIFLKDTNGRYLLGNREFEKWHSATSEDVEGSTVYERFKREDADVFASQDHRVLETRSALEEEVKLQFPDGKTRAAMVIKFPVFGPDGDAVAVGGFNIDIGDRKRAEEALRESEARLRDVAESAGDWIWEMGSDLRFTYLSQRFYELFAVAPDQILGKTRAEFAGTQTDDLRWRSHLDDLSHHKPFRNFEYAVRVPDGPTKYIRISGKPVFDPAGTFLGYRGTGTDVTAEVEAETAAAEARARLFDAVESITAGFALFDKDDKLVLCNNRYRNLHPLMYRLAVPGMSFQKIVRGVAEAGIYDPSMGEIDEFVKRRLVYHRNTPSNHEQRLSDGRCVEIQEYGTHDGGTVLLWTDITERKLLEKQLVGAQRMEALGKLTGGVAHDFNNLLTVILGNLQLLERRVECDPRLKKCVDLAADAAARGSELTSRLLAFSRRQILRTKIICVNSLITDIEPLLRGTLGATIQLENKFAGELWPVMTDATQLESALLNLAINARDAMPDGGKLVIETANVTLDDHYVTQNADVRAGHYVMVAVTDTGRGMSQEIVEHVFEPFFSTKDKGKGTGLGLSMVYGFLKQSDGHIKVYSEEAHGTVVKLYLPRAGDAEAQPVRHITFDESVPLGDEIILLVEDDVRVRQTAVALLEDLGYRVFQAADGPTALRMLDKHPNIDLLFTDVIMPHGMKGPDLAREVRKRRPEIKVLYTSGYTDTAVVRDGQLEFGPLLSKPFRKLDLAVKVREALDS